LFEAPVISIWVDMIFIVIFFAVINKFVQHLTIDPKKYFYIKHKSKMVNKEIQQLAKEQKQEEAKQKQKEAFKMMGNQFKLTQKSMFVMLIIAFPLLWFVKKYYYDFVYNFILFSVNGLWAYVILGVIISMVISGIYDKTMIKKYYPEGVTDKIEKTS
jgi:uncharacterized membrane protein (DUF106 family)